MTEEVFKRKLTSILSADVVGYSRLMENDEEATIRTLKTYRSTIAELVQQYRGRIVDAPGDNLMAEFASVVDAVNCAVEIQRNLAERSEELPEERRMLFRIGVNLGDVVEEEGQIYGDGVNIAARLEGLAEAGGVYISRTAFDQVKNKSNLGYKYLGEHDVKNIAEPVRVYKILMEAENRGKVIGERNLRSNVKKWFLLFASATLLLIIGALAIYNGIFRLPQVSIASDQEISIELPKGPSIAVLPFINLSDNPNQEYFSDGLTENIITGLSACPKIFVIARNSAFTYKGKPVNVQKIAEELGVQYVLEGSVQKSNSRVRVTVKLIDAGLGHPIWANKYDRDLKDIFILQDEITIKLMTALEVELTEGEQASMRYKGPYSLEALMIGLKALECFRRHNKEDNHLARKKIKEVINLFSDYSEPYLLLAMTYLMDLWYGSDHPMFTFAQASRYLKKAMNLDENNSDAYTVLSYLCMMKGDHGQAIAAAMTAVDLNPNGADAISQLGNALHKAGRSVDAVNVIKKAIELNPIPPGYYYRNLGNAYGAQGKYEDALAVFEKAIKLEPSDIFSHLGLTVVLSLLGRTKEAQGEAKEVLRINPKFSIKTMENVSTVKNNDWNERWFNAARKAGLQ